MHRLLSMIALSIALAGRLAASPRDELASPVQSVRDQAAATLRDTYQSIPESKWQPVVDSIKVGQTKESVLHLLAPFHVTAGMGAGGGGGYTESYILDDGWALICWYTTNDNALLGRQLQKVMRSVWVKPPENFTGKWITYFVNGQKSHEIDYQAGRYFGEFVSFHDNGSRAVVQHYAKAGVIGEDTGYFPSGHLKYKGRYEGGKQVGKWIWYDDDGSVANTREEAGLYAYCETYAPGKPQNPHGILFCGGSSLRVAFEQVVTPLGEFIGATDEGSGAWRQVEPGRKVVANNASAVSEAPLLAGSFEHPPKGVGSDWFYLVKMNVWVNPGKVARVDPEQLAANSK